MPRAIPPSLQKLSPLPRALSS
uniref:Uncharacterized protein n=1 Tax=Arundo donax TaxID=35708 RepID=A0A0A9FEX4_ARUDO